MKAVPFLQLGDVEIANSLRTLSYVRQGLAGSRTTVMLCQRVTESFGYEDLYDDIYLGDPLDPRNLACYCADADTGPYADPAYDLAPWYDDAYPESADFLGLIPEVRISSVLSRKASPRARGGATIGPAHAMARRIEVGGFMVASSGAGMNYGERWLGRALAGTAGGCSPDTLTVIPACGGDTDSDQVRELAAVGLVDAPEFSGAIRDETNIQAVAFQLMAGEPYLRKVTVEETEVDLATNPSTCVTLDNSGPLPIEVASRLVITAGSGELNGLRIYGRHGACPQVGTAAVTYEVVGLPAFYELTIDASLRSVSARNATGTAVSGLQFLSFSGLFEWLTAYSGAQLCVCVSTSDATGLAGATVSIDSVRMEA